MEPVIKEYLIAGFCFGVNIMGNPSYRSVEAQIIGAIDKADKRKQQPKKVVKKDKSPKPIRTQVVHY